jgi:hypothetical protein
MPCRCVRVFNGACGGQYQFQYNVGGFPLYRGEKGVIYFDKRFGIWTIGQSIGKPPICMAAHSVAKFPYLIRPALWTALNGDSKIIDRVVCDDPRAPAAKCFNKPPK